MYRLVSLKGITVPEGYQHGTLGEWEAASYLYRIGMEDDAFALLDTLKGIQIPEGASVVAERAGKEITLDAGSEVPIHLGSSGDTWEEFEKFVRDDTRNINNKWEIIKEGDDGKKEHITSSEISPEDNARAVVQLYKEAVRGALDSGQAARAFSLIRKAQTYLDSQEKSFSTAAFHNIKRTFGGAFNNLLHGMMESTDAGVTLTGAKKDRRIEEVHENLRTQLQDADFGEELLKGLNNLGGSWSIGTEEVEKEPLQFTNAGRVGQGLLELDQRKTHTAKDRTYLTLTWDPDGEKNIDAALAFLSVGSKPIDNVAQLTDLMKDTGKGYKSLRLDDLGINYELSSGLKQRLNQNPFVFAAELTTSRFRENYARLEGTQGEIKVPREHQHIINQFINLDDFVDEYHQDSREEVLHELLDRGFFTNEWTTGLTTIAGFSDGVVSTDEGVTAPAENLGLRMTLAYKRGGHRHILQGVAPADVEQLEKFLGKGDLSSQLDGLLMSADLTGREPRKSRAVYHREVGRRMLPNLEDADAEKFGRVLEESGLLERARLRREFGHASVLARVSASYITSRSYSRLFSQWTSYLCGGDAVFDEYSQSFHGNGRRVPLAVMAQIPYCTTGTVGKISTPAYEKACEVNGETPVEGINRDAVLQKLLTITRAGGVSYSGSKLAPALRDAIQRGASGRVFTGMMGRTNIQERAPTTQGAQMYLRSQEYAAQDLLSSPKREDIEVLTNNAEGNRSEAFDRVKDSLRPQVEKMLGTGAAQLIDGFLSHRTNLSSTSKLYGAYLENIQMVATAVGVLHRYGGQESLEFHPGQREFSPSGDDTTFRNVISKTPEKSLPNIDHLTFTDPKGGRHFIVPNVTNSGGVDLAHLHQEGKTLHIHPHEYKSSRGERTRTAHIGSTSNFALTLRAVLGGLEDGSLNTVVSNSTVEQNLTYDRNGAPVISLRNDNLYKTDAHNLQRNGVTATTVKARGEKRTLYDLNDIEGHISSVFTRQARTRRDLTPEQRSLAVRESLNFLGIDDQ